MMIELNKLFLLYSNLLFIFIYIAICQSNNRTILTEEKTLNLLNPILVQKLWNRKSCLTYRARIGTCLTLNECQSFNGKVGGLCLGLFSICCLFNERNDSKLSLNSRCLTNSNRTGICLKEKNCLLKLGKPDGFCGSPLYSCCQIESICGKTITKNETEIVNDLYPRSTVDPNVCQVIIERQTNICQIRIELLEFYLAQPDSKGRCTTDALIIKTTVGESIPIICGDNSGQHLYVESGRNVPKYGKPIRLSIVTNGMNIQRKWRIKLVMIECDSLQMAPNGCLQYFPYISGIVRSFNYGQKIKNLARYMSDLSYTICVRPEENYCWIEWSLEYSDTFSWGSPLAWNQTLSPLNVKDRCSADDFITINDGLNADKTPEFDRICGQRLSKQNYLFSQSKPFHLKVRSNIEHKPNAENSQNEQESKYSQMNDKNSTNKTVDKSDDKDRDEDNDDEYEEEYNPVNECAFWHIEATAGNVFNTGMLVEIEHSPLKYWLATVVGAFGQLLSLKWEGAENEPDFWFDLKNRKIYPVGYYRDNRDFKIEPPINLKLETKNIVDVTVKYFKNQTSIASCVKLNLFTKYGFTNLSDIFMPQSVVIEVSHEFEPHKHWFAKVVDNFGGRLTLEWVETLDSTEETKDDVEANQFYLYFCSPRVSYLGFANSKVEDEFFYCPPNDSVTNTEKIIDKYLDDSSSEVNQLVKSVILSAKELQPNLYKNGCLEQIKVNDKVLVFPNKLLKLCPASVEKVSMDGQHLIIKCDSDESIRFCYPSHDNHCFLPLNWAEEYQISGNFGDGGVSKFLRESGSRGAPITLLKDSRIDEFEMNTKLEVIHPKDKNKICEGIIIRITPPLIWIEIASDTITVLPYNSTEIYPLGWCHNNGLEAIKLLTNDKKNFKNTAKEEVKPIPKREVEEDEDSNLPSSPTMASSQSQCSSKSWCPRIFINHKCFTGPALSKSKICELPQYVGPGPITLVLQEVISKIIQVAYVPNRVLNELSSQTFQDLLKKKDIKKTDEIMFKAKYQKRTYRDDVLVARNADQVEEYCRCVCGHLKCCYNLFSPFQFSGDDCPSNCRGLTKSNKYLKRAGYYRDKARHNRLAQNKKKMTLLPTNEDNDNNDTNNDNNSTTEINNIKARVKSEVKIEDSTNSQPTNDGSSDESTNNDNIPIDAEELHKQQQQKKNAANNQTSKKSKNSKSKIKRKRSVIEEEEIEVDENEDIDNPLYWTITDVHDYLKKSNCFMFAPTLREHEVDGAALLLLDYNTITSLLYSGYTRQYCMADATKLSALVESLRHKWARIAKRIKK